MAQIKANGLELEYDTFGDPDRVPLLLVMGLGAQMISWDEEFCELLAGRGFHVIRFDNRDCGLSTRLDHLAAPTLSGVLDGSERAPYALEDMADDAAALLDGLGVEAAHVVTPEAMEALLKPPPSDREGMIEHGVWISSRICGPEHFDPEEARQKRTRAVDRSVSVAGTARQLAAVATARSRVAALRTLDLPALVVHGEADPLVPVENGRRTAEAIPGARLLLLPTMGHDLPRAYWPQIVDAIADTAHKVDERVPV